MASQELPQLPAFLTQPAICTNIFCRSIDRTLPSTPVEFESLLHNWFFEHFRLRFRDTAAKLAVEKEDAISDYILDCIKLLPPKMFTAQLTVDNRMGEREMAEFSCPPFLLTLFFISSLQNLARQMRIALADEDEKPDRCLHDLLDASQIETWHRIIRLDENPIADDEYDPSRLFDRISTAIANGEVQHLERWGATEEWQEDVLLLRAERLRSIRMGEKFVTDYEGCIEKSGYRGILERPGAIVAVLSQALPLLVDGQDSTPALRNAPQIKQLIKFCESPLPLCRSVLAAAPPPISPTSESKPDRDDALPAGSRSTSSVTLTFPSSTLAAPFTRLSPHQDFSTTFDRLEKVKIFSEGYPPASRLVPARMCPPDRCSGRTPDISKYETVDGTIRALFLLAMKRYSLNLVDSSRVMLQKLIIRWSAAGLTSLDSTGSARQDQLREVLVAACEEPNDPLGPLSGDRAVAAAMSSVAGSLLDANKDGANAEKTRMPCLCDLTHLCPALERIRLDKFDLHKKEMRKLYKGAIAETFDKSSMYSGMEGVIGAGLVSRSCWTADWKVEFGAIMDIFRPVAVKQMFFRHDIFTRSLTQLSKLVSSTQILEEVLLYRGGAPNPVVSVFAVRHWHPMNMHDVAPVTSVAIKGMADGFANMPESPVEGSLTRSTEVIRYYQWAILLDSTNVSARLNAAAIRLRFADDKAQYSQWTRAIYDCTAALYYGDPSFKAYYRRGYALAHLKMWDKAILDYKQALEIEPKNVRVEQCLIAARKRVAVE